jgi:hypothetical protein
MVVPSLGRAVHVVLTDAYTAGRGGRAGGLADTGSGAVTGYLWIAGLLVAIGITLVRQARRIG